MRNTLTLLIAAAALAGCAGLNSLTSEVSTYSQWPADRKPGSYAFERLPSQRGNPEQQERLENSARGAIEGAGFTPAADPASSEFVVLLGARVSAYDRYYYYDDPFWWRGSLYYSRFGRPYIGHGFGLGLGFGFPSPTYEREVAVLIRDRKTGTPLYEARATNDGASSAILSLLPAMYEAAMTDFPHGGPNPRKVTTPITRE